VDVARAEVRRLRASAPQIISLPNESLGIREQKGSSLALL
jgi:hypothetical protein